MGKHCEKVQSRRELFAAVLRYATLGTLGSIGAAVFVRRRRLLREGKCINSGICRGCGIFEECSLPQALSAKQLQKAEDRRQTLTSDK